VEIDSAPRTAITWTASSWDFFMPSAKKKSRPKTGTPRSESPTISGAAPAKDQLARKAPKRAKATPKAKRRSAKSEHPEAKNIRPASDDHKRTPVDEALRAAGLGENRFAKTLELFIRRVSARKGEEKLLLDGLKEWGRHFERSRATERATDPPVFVHLVHNVPRPERPPPRLPAAPLAEAVDPAAPSVGTPFS
jgi:hypothetical protein